jgi:hypothetical protein
VLADRKHFVFKAFWRTTNVLLVVCLAGMVYAAGWEYSVRQYLKGFSDAVVPATATPEQKVEAILSWMRSGPPRALAVDPDALSHRDPETTLNYQQLLSICGTATNAFLNLARSSDLNVRRLLLLTPERTTKHVVAEVLLDEKWAIVLERESFFVLCAFVVGSLFLLFMREMLAWYADRKLKIPRFHLREHFARAGAAFFRTPEIKQ